jgi:hypothetical protein
LKENTEKYLHNLQKGKDLLNNTEKVLTSKERIDKFNHIKTKHLKSLKKVKIIYKLGQKNSFNKYY